MTNDVDTLMKNADNINATFCNGIVVVDWRFRAENHQSTHNIEYKRTQKTAWKSPRGNQVQGSDHGGLLAPIRLTALNKRLTIHNERPDSQHLLPEYLPTMCTVNK